MSDWGAMATNRVSTSYVFIKHPCPSVCRKELKAQHSLSCSNLARFLAAGAADQANAYGTL